MKGILLTDLQQIFIVKIFWIEKISCVVNKRYSVVFCLTNESDTPRPFERKHETTSLLFRVDGDLFLDETERFSWVISHVWKLSLTP